MRKIESGEIIVAALAGFLGAFAFLALTDFALFRAEWCVAGESHCLRDWIGALSGWAAACAAGATILVLLQQAGHANAAVAIAQSTLDAQRASAERQLRAYVLVGSVRHTGFKQDEGTPTLLIALKNSGQTPAYKVTVRFSWDLVVAAPTDLLINKYRTPFADIGPGQDITFKMEMGSEAIDAAWEDLENGSVSLFCWGVVEYTDAFDGRRTTTYCFQLVLDENSDASFGMTAIGNAF
jgi:hypothetical protein